VGVTTSYGPLPIWSVILVVGLFTFAIRHSFIFLFGRLEGMPPRVERALRFVPAAVFAALVAPAVVSPGPTVGATLADPRLPAAAVATLVAWRTEDVLATLVAGMGVFWFVRFG
jgi:branched-subunit amino acid transport protein